MSIFSHGGKSSKCHRYSDNLKHLFKCFERKSQEKRNTACVRDDIKTIMSGAGSHNALGGKIHFRNKSILWEANKMDIFIIYYYYYFNLHP